MTHKTDCRKAHDCSLQGCIEGLVIDLVSTSTGRRQTKAFRWGQSPGKGRHGGDIGNASGTGMGQRGGGAMKMSNIQRGWNGLINNNEQTQCLF